MQIHDIRTFLLNDSLTKLLKDSFPLKLGEYEVEIGRTYQIKCI